MNRTLVIRAGGLLLLVVLLLVALYPVLAWDPGNVGSGGEGFTRLREWSALTREDGDRVRRDELQASFQVRRSHLGKLWYSARDEDGRCWVLSVSPLAVLPEPAQDASWCDP